jgi:eukaryotic-like serine/threonine-protein kinase
VTSGRVDADWYPDPLGHGEYRYWDGESWTAWVATAGVTRSDPFDSSVSLPDPSLLAPAAGSLATVAPSPPPVPYSAPRFRSIAGLTTAITWVAIVAAVSALASAIAFANRYAKIDTFSDRQDFASLLDVRSADDAVDTTSTILVIVSLAIFVLVIVYFYRASSNTDLWNRERKTWATGWTIGAWFIPLGNIVLVPLVVTEIWRRSPDPGDRERGAAPSVAPVVVWWILVVVGFVTASFDVDPDTFDEYRVQDLTHVVGCVVLIAAAVLLINVTRALTRRQSAWQALEGQPA